ncbi:MAG: hypothetical protein JJ864_08630 [Rhizobiaceae bacterium]|nr:hypothetical protein [Rhizobiaceae bacterium]
MGNELIVGDVIDTWMGRRRIVGLLPYSGPLAPLWDVPAHIAELDIGPSMTIEPQVVFDRVCVA